MGTRSFDPARRIIQTKAFQLREHASELEKLEIASHYYQSVTGELDKAVRTYQEEIESYPRRSVAYRNLGLAYSSQGQYEKAAEVTRQGLQVDPDSFNFYGNRANFTLSLQRLDGARQIIHDAQARNLDALTLRDALYLCHGGRYDAGRNHGTRLRETLSSGNAGAGALAAGDSGATGAE